MEDPLRVIAQELRAAFPTWFVHVDVTARVFAHENLDPLAPQVVVDNSGPSRTLRTDVRRRGQQKPVWLRTRPDAEARALAAEIIAALKEP